MRLPIPPPPQGLTRSCDRSLRQLDSIELYALLLGGPWRTGGNVVNRLRRLLLQIERCRPTRVPRGQNRQRHGSQHKYDRRYRGGLRQQRGRPSRTERRLLTHAAKSSGQIRSLAALQQDHNNQKQTHHYVQNR